MRIINCHNIFIENAKYQQDKTGFELIELHTGTIWNFVKAEFVRGENLIVWGAHCQPEWLLNKQKIHDLKYTIMQSENADQITFDAAYIKLAQNNKVLDWSPNNAKELKSKHDIDVDGFFIFEFPPFKEKTDKLYDLFFTGGESPDRKELLNKIKEDNPNLNCHFDLTQAGETENTNDFNEAIRNSKYVLNIPYKQKHALATHRINKALSMGCQVISPHSSDKRLNEIYKDHVHFGDIQEVIKNIENLIPKKTWSELLDSQGAKDLLETTLGAKTNCEEWSIWREEYYKNQ